MPARLRSRLRARVRELLKTLTEKPEPSRRSSQEIVLVATPEVDGALLRELARALAPGVGHTVRSGGRFELRPEEEHADRGQYDAKRILRRLVVPGHSVLLAVTETDLFAADMEFVFGHADALEGLAVMSLHRLAPRGQRTFGNERFAHRVLTEAVHQVGHLLGLDHCPEPSCAMHFSTSLRETDEKRPNYCPRCQKAVR